jgi:hypothetical protein
VLTVLQDHFEFNDRERGPSLDTTFQVSANGTLAAVETRGIDYLKNPVEERYTVQGISHSWKNAAEDEKREVSGSAFYLSLESPPEEAVLLVRAALRAPGKKLPLLPSGEAQVAVVGTYTVKGKAGSRRVTLYALSGLDLTPSYLWLDAEQRFFASVTSWSKVIREGFEDVTDQLDRIQQGEQRRLSEARAKELTTRLDRPLAITHARVFDPGTLAVEEDQTVIVTKGRITAVGPSSQMTVPPGAKTLDAQGRFLMPGLWDMHVHFSQARKARSRLPAG